MLRELIMHRCVLLFSIFVTVLPIARRHVRQGPLNGDTAWQKNLCPKRSSLSFTLSAALSLWATLRQPLRVDSKFCDLSRCPRSSADQEPNGRCLDKKRVGHNAVFNSGDDDRWSLRRVVHLVFQGPGWGAIAPMLANRCRTATPHPTPPAPPLFCIPSNWFP